MKKAIAILLALVMTMTLLAGCGSSTTQQSTNSAQAATVKSDASNNSQSTSDTDTVIGTVEGHWSDKTTKLGDVETTLYVLNNALVNCTEVTIQINVEMKAGTHCENWVLWARVNGSVEKCCEFELPGGDGAAEVTFTFDPSLSFDAITVTPTVPGGCSWDLGLGVVNAHVAK